MSHLTRFIFFGNVFYGICAVALSVETNVRLGIHVNSISFYLLIFLSTLVYYGRIYYKTSRHRNIDVRTEWYRTHGKLIKFFLIIAAAASVFLTLYLLLMNFRLLPGLPPAGWLIIVAVLLAGNLYTFKLSPVKQLRKVGWLKPFLVGFVWAGIVGVFPVLYSLIRYASTSSINTLQAGLLWLQNFLFITSLAIIFDIKDHDADSRHQLKTFPAMIGTNITLLYTVLPLAFLSFSTLIAYSLVYHLSALQTIVQLAPYIALVIVVKNLAAQKNLLFYLAVVDGLMLLKAICGIISQTFL